MSVHTFTIKDKTLGFTLKKQENNPVIDKITPGGALETELVNNCSSITSGCIIKSIGDDDISQLPYEIAVEKIKSWKERPINISIVSPNNSPKKVIRDSFVTTNNSYKMSVEEMNKQSEIATKKALKELSNMQKNNTKLLEDDDEDDDSSGYKSIPLYKYRNLENKMNILRMDLLNSNVDNDELKTELDKQVNPLKCINDELCHINTLSIRNNNVKNMNSEDMKLYLSKVNNEFRDYVTSIDKYLDKIQLYEIKNSIIYKVNKEKDNFESFNNYYTYKIKIKNIYELMQTVSLMVFSIIFILLIINNTF